jgi:hypothetical protein
MQGVAKAQLLATIDGEFLPEQPGEIIRQLQS